MFAKTSAVVMSIFMAVASIFGAPFQSSDGSSSSGDQPNPQQGLYSELPEGATDATSSQLESIRTGTWVSVIRPTTTSILFREYVTGNDPGSYADDPKQEFPGGKIPSDRQHFTANGGCNAYVTYIHFNDAVMDVSDYGISTMMGCDDLRTQQQAEFNAFLQADPTVKVVPGNESKEIFLVTDEGAVAFHRK